METLAVWVTAVVTQFGTALAIPLLLLGVTMAGVNFASNNTLAAKSWLIGATGGTGLLLFAPKIAAAVQAIPHA